MKLLGRIATNYNCDKLIFDTNGSIFESLKMNKKIKIDGYVFQLGNGILVSYSVNNGLQQGFAMGITDTEKVIKHFERFTK